MENSVDPDQMALSKFKYLSLVKAINSVNFQFY